MNTLDRAGMGRDLPIDGDVMTIDHDKLGTVGEIRGDCFKVNAAMQPDYWLPMHCVSNVSGMEILLDFTKDRLGDHKMSEPRAA